MDEYPQDKFTFNAVELLDVLADVDGNIVIIDEELVEVVAVVVVVGTMILLIVPAVSEIIGATVDVSDKNDTTAAVVVLRSVALLVAVEVAICADVDVVAVVKVVLVSGGWYTTACIVPVTNV